MRAPVTRRSGFSRRSQYGLFFGYVLAVAGALLGLLMVITAHFDPDGNNALRGVVQDVTSPVSTAGHAIVRGSVGAWDAVSAYIDAGSRNRAMAHEVAADRTALIAGRNALFENGRLRALLKIEPAGAMTVATGQLVASSGENSRRYALLNRGYSAGVMAGQPVRGPDGLVGQVIQTGLISSQVLMIIDSGAVVPARRMTDGMPAFTRGIGDGRLTMAAATPGANPFKIGDVFVTSGTGGIYPPGIPVCIVTALDHDAAVARPLADPARLDFAIVERPFITPPPAPPEIKAKAKARHKAHR